VDTKATHLIHHVVTAIVEHLMIPDLHENDLQYYLEEDWLVLVQKYYSLEPLVTPEVYCGNFRFVDC
jgi:hypothetical protein